MSSLEGPRNQAETKQKECFCSAKRDVRRTQMSSTPCYSSWMMDVSLTPKDVWCPTPQRMRIITCAVGLGYLGCRFLKEKDIYYLTIYIEFVHFFQRLSRKKSLAKTQRSYPFLCLQVFQQHLGRIDIKHRESERSEGSRQNTRRAT